MIEGLTKFEAKVLAALERQARAQALDLVATVYPGAKWWRGRAGSAKIGAITKALERLRLKGLVYVGRNLLREVWTAMPRKEEEGDANATQTA